jgi:hypothetical protein
MVPMNAAEEAKEFFRKLDERLWDDAVDHLASEFMAEFAPHIRFRLECLRNRFISEADLQIPDDERQLFKVWLEAYDCRREAERELAQANHEQPDEAWELGFELVPPARVVIGEVTESETRSIVVYRRGGP